mmetsp:Transcript_44721/g.119759  ORF Transcript_44721/g.119759 Transcript_44721/m.119759 type:complete len:336 (-) Transcript_44721:189-1196(-)
MKSASKNIVHPLATRLRCGVEIPVTQHTLMLMLHAVAVSVVVCPSNFLRRSTAAGEAVLGVRLLFLIGQIKQRIGFAQRMDYADMIIQPSLPAELEILALGLRWVQTVAIVYLRPAGVLQQGKVPRVGSPSELLGQTGQRHATTYWRRRLVLNFDRWLPIGLPQCLFRLAWDLYGIPCQREAGSGLSNHECFFRHWFGQIAWEPETLFCDAVQRIVVYPRVLAFKRNGKRHCEALEDEIFYVLGRRDFRPVDVRVLNCLHELNHALPYMVTLTLTGSQAPLALPPQRQLLVDVLGLEISRVDIITEPTPDLCCKVGSDNAFFKTCCGFVPFSNLG